MKRANTTQRGPNPAEFIEAIDVCAAVNEGQA